MNREATRNSCDCIFECRIWCCPVRHLSLSRRFRQCNSGFAANGVYGCSFSGTSSFSASVKLSHVHWCRWMLHPHPFFLRPRVFRCASFAAGYRPRVNSQRPIQSSSNIRLSGSWSFTKPTTCTACGRYAAPYRFPVVIAVRKHHQ